MLRYPAPLERVIEELERLPGIGPKSAQRLALFMLGQPAPRAQVLAETLARLHEGISPCEECFNYAAARLCPVCADPSRDRRLLCVVESAPDLMALERAGEYHGYYHVLGGALSPLSGVGPGDLRIAELLERARRDAVEEVILATSPTVEGDATAEYLRQLLAQELTPPPRLTRIALGLPVGADLDYADQVTLARALRGRTVM
ncbi:MAG TPA: recombination mediator RecR [Armatimonadota bacterium]|jgi:recombination protein RecR